MNLKISTVNFKGYVDYSDCIAERFNARPASERVLPDWWDELSHEASKNFNPYDYFKTQKANIKAYGFYITNDGKTKYVKKVEKNTQSSKQKETSQEKKVNNSNKIFWGVILTGVSLLATLLTKNVIKK